MTNNTVDMLGIGDNGGRRKGVDRRHYSYSGHIPERRKGIDRRIMTDRRQDLMPVESAQGQRDFERRNACNVLAC